MAVIGQSLIAPEAGWKRIETTEKVVSRVGAWTSVSYTDYSGGQAYYSQTPGDYYEFKVFGSKFRLIETMNYNRPKQVDVYVNGVRVDAFNLYSPDKNLIALVYEKVFPEKGIYTVRVVHRGASGEYLTADAIDLLSDDELMATVGQQLTSPQTGWTRVETTGPAVMKIGAWSSISAVDYSAGQLYASQTPGDYYEFKISGSQFRLIEAISSNRAKRSDVYINGVFIESFVQYSPTTQYKTVVYEKVFPEKGIYTVRVVHRGASGEYITADAIDFPRGTEFIPVVGSRIAPPAAGWVRYDDKHPGFIYKGTWVISSGTTYGFTADSARYSAVAGDSLAFTFSGSKLRIYTYSNSDTSGYSIKIDGTDYGNVLTTQKEIYTLLSFEKLDLSPGLHKVELVVLPAGAAPGSTMARLSFDAIDIDASGSLLEYVPPTKGQLRTQVKDMEIGDYIKAGTDLVPDAGVSTLQIVSIGQSPLPMLPLDGSLDGIGSFYFIKTSTGMLVADRVIQNKVIWTDLNNKGLTEGSLIDLAGGAYSKYAPYRTELAKIFDRDVTSYVEFSQIEVPIKSFVDINVRFEQRVDVLTSFDMYFDNVTTASQPLRMELRDRNGNLIFQQPTKTYPRGAWTTFNVNVPLNDDFVRLRVYRYDNTSYLLRLVELRFQVAASIAPSDLFEYRMPVGGNAYNSWTPLNPPMTGPTSSAGAINASSFYKNDPTYAPYRAMDGLKADSGWASDGVIFPQWLEFAFNVPQPVDFYSVTARNNSTYALTQTVKDWAVQAWDGANWVEVDRRQNQVGWAAGETRVYPIKDGKSYSKYRMYCTANSGDTNAVSIGEWKLYNRVSFSNYSLTEASTHAWPANNEWDVNITNFPKELIQDGLTLDDVFHFNSFTWCQDTPVNGFSGLTTQSSNRTLRGNYITYASSEVGGVSAGAVGFRPVLAYEEER